MAGIGAISITSAGAVTAPTDVVNLSQGSDLSATVFPAGLYDQAPLGSLRGMMLLHGAEAMRHVVEGSSYRTGLLPPKVTQVAASSGDRATATLTATGNFSDGDQIRIGHFARARLVTAKTALVTNGTIGDQFLIGASLTISLANLKKLVQHTGQHGVEYWNTKIYSKSASGIFLFSDLSDADIECTASDATTATFRAGTYGTGPNSYKSQEVTDGGTTFSFGGTTFSGGTAGSGTAPDKGTYRYGYAHVRTGDVAQSGLSNTTQQLSQSNNMTVNQTSFVDAATRDATTHFRSFRTQHNGDRYWRVKDSPVGDGEPYTDTFSDDSITGAFALTYDPSIYRAYAAGYPVVCKYGCNFRERVVMGGADIAADYSIGTASVTNASDSVTLSSTARPTAAMIGRTFRVSGDAQGYVILDVAEATRILTLNGNYQGGTDATATYSIKDERDPFEVYWSVTGLPNNYPVAYSAKGVSSKDARGITGFASAFDSALIFTRTNMWRLTGLEGIPLLRKQGDGMGAFGGHAIQVADGIVYWLGPDGVFGWDGEDNPVPLSSVFQLNNEPRGIADTIARINGDQGDQIVSAYNPSDRIIYWFVPLDGEDRNNYCLTYQIDSGSFSLDRCAEVTAATTLPDADGRFRTLVGDPYGCVFEIEQSTSDGAYGSDPVGTVTSYTAATKTITCSAAGFSSSWQGCPVLHVIATTGEVQHGKVATSTSTTVVLCSPFTTAPVAGDVVIVGGIAWNVKTSRFDFQRPESQKWVSAVTASYVPQSAGQMWCAVGMDNSSPSVSTIGGSADVAALTNSDGEHRFVFGSTKGRRIQVEFLALVPGFEVRMPGFVPSIRMNPESPQ